jgi:hypothetical protein
MNIRRISWWYYPIPHELTLVMMMMIVGVEQRPGWTVHLFIVACGFNQHISSYIVTIFFFVINLYIYLFILFICTTCIHQWNSPERGSWWFRALLLIFGPLFEADTTRSSHALHMGTASNQPALGLRSVQSVRDCCLCLGYGQLPVSKVNYFPYEPVGWGSEWIVVPLKWSRQQPPHFIGDRKTDW